MTELADFKDVNSEQMTRGVYSYNNHYFYYDGAQPVTNSRGSFLRVVWSSEKFGYIPPEMGPRILPLHLEEILPRARKLRNQADFLEKIEKRLQGEPEPNFLPKNLQESLDDFLDKSKKLGITPKELTERVKSYLEKKI